MWGSPSGAGRQSGHGRLLSPRGSGGTEVVVPQSTRPSCRLDISREEALHGVAISSITSAAWGKGPLGEGRKQTPRVRVAQGDCCGCQPAHPLPLRGCSGCTEQSQGPAGAAAGPGVLRAAPPAGLAAGPKWPGVGLGYWQGRCCQVVLEGARLGSGFCFVGDSEGCAWCLTGKGAPRQSWHWAGIPRGARWPQGHPCPGRLTTDWRPQGRGLGGHLGLPSVIDPCGPLKGSPPTPALAAGRSQSGFMASRDPGSLGSGWYPHFMEGRQPRVFGSQNRWLCWGSTVLAWVGKDSRYPGQLWSPAPPSPGTACLPGPGASR